MRTTPSAPASSSPASPSTDSAPSESAQAAWAVAERLERLIRVLADRARAHGLNSAQWTALRYIAGAEPGTRHVSAFAAFHLTSPSSASQTVTALVRKGLVAKQPGADARRRTLSVTEKGRHVLAQDPLAHIVEQIQRLPESQRGVLAEIMDVLTRSAPATLQAKAGAVRTGRPQFCS